MLNTIAYVVSNPPVAIGHGQDLGGLHAQVLEYGRPPDLAINHQSEALEGHYVLDAKGEEVRGTQRLPTSSTGHDYELTHTPPSGRVTCGSLVAGTGFEPVTSGL